MELYPYQKACLKAILDAYLRGVMAQIIVLATGGGKTEIFARIRGLLKFRKKMLVLAHREELLSQARNKIKRANPELWVDIEQAKLKASNFAQIVVASVETLGRAATAKNACRCGCGCSNRIERFERDDFEAVITDECFPAYTKVDGVPIESRRIGDLIWSVNTYGLYEKRPVTHVFKSRPGSLLRIWFVDGTSLVCTPRHPIYCAFINRYKPAISLSRNDIIIRRRCETTNLRRLSDGVYSEKLEQPDDSDLLGEMQSCSTRRTTETSNPSLSWMRCRRGLRWEKASMGQSGSGMVSGRLQGEIPEREVIQSYGRHQLSNMLCKNENEQSNAQGWLKRKDGFNPEGDRSQTEDSRRERTWFNDASSYAVRSSGICLGKRADSSDSDDEVKRLAKPLLNRYSKREIQNCYRGGRRIALYSGTEETGRTEDGFFEVLRVDSVEILEPGSNGEFGGLCPGGFVYNLEVAENKNYFADNILVHNCHHSTADSYRRVFRHFGVGEMGGCFLLGVTATPERTDGEPLEQVYDEVVYEKHIKDLMRKDAAEPKSPYLSPIRAWRIDTSEDLSKVKTNKGDFAEKELAEAVNTEYRNTLAVRSYQERTPGKRAIVFCVNVQHATDMAAYFMAAGIPAKCVVGATETEDRTPIYRDFHEGTVLVLTCVAVLTEGYDEPRVETIIMARPTQSVLVYTQMLGRGTRLCDICRVAGCIHKPYLTVLDLCDNTRHQLPSVASLLGLPNKFDFRGRDAMEQYEAMEKLAEERPAILHKAMTLEAARRMMQEISIIEDIDYREEMMKISNFAWVKLPDKRLVISLDRSLGELIRITQDMVGKWHCLHITKTEMMSLGLFPTMQEAVRRCDAWILKHRYYMKNLLDVKTRLSTEPPTPKQEALLRNLKRWRNGMTKGEASSTLDSFFGRGKTKSLDKKEAKLRGNGLIGAKQETIRLPSVKSERIYNQGGAKVYLSRGNGIQQEWEF